MTGTKEATATRRLHRIHRGAQAIRHRPPRSLRERTRAAGVTCPRSMIKRGRRCRFRLLCVTLGITRPATALELMTAVVLVPAVRRPLISVAYSHGVAADPDVPMALPSPVSGRPRITAALNGDDFNPLRRRSYLDDDAARERRSGRNATRERQCHQQASNGSIPRSVRVPSSTTCSGRRRGAMRCSSHDVHLGFLSGSPTRAMIHRSRRRVGTLAHTLGQWVKRPSKRKPRRGLRSSSIGPIPEPPTLPDRAAMARFVSGIR